MKKTFFLLAMAAFIASCGSNNNDGGNTQGDNKAAADTGMGPATAATPTGDVSTHPDYKKGLALIGQSDCLTCHKVSEKVVGPAYQEVAERYAGKPGIEDTLAGKIINGGSGNWGQIPMAPHPQISKEDAVAMVKYILLLKDQK
jgi:cytochrome c